MIDSFEKAEQLTADIRKFIQNKIECYELKAIDKASKMTQVVLVRLAIHSFMMLILFVH